MTWHIVLEARKDHECYYCRQPIKKGTFYSKLRYINNEDKFEGYKMHQDCEEKYQQKLVNLDAINDYFEEKINDIPT